MTVSGHATFTAADVELDVSGVVPVDEPCAIAGTVLVPEAPAERPVVVVALPGGTYRRRYFDLEPPGRDAYSQAAYFAGRGVAFAAMDYLGGGDSSRPTDGEVLSMPVLAAAAHEAAQALRAGLEEGRYGAPLAEPLLVGLGWSFGGCISIVQQGTHGTYDALAILGHSVLAADAHMGSEVPDDWDSMPEPARREFVRARNEAVVGEELAVYHGHGRRGALQPLYYGESIDEELVRYDEENLHTLVSRSAGIDVMTPGFARPFAERVCCPVFLGFGDTDLTLSPRAEGEAYPASDHLTITVVPGMAHVHNLAPTRRVLWDRLLAWLETVRSLA